MLIVAALGGNALLRRTEPLDLTTERHNARAAARALAPIVRAHRTVVTHGNGPQVGLLALRDGDVPFDVLGAETEGQIGYILAQELTNRLPDIPVATLLTQTVVAEDDPALRTPTKPVGPVYAADKAAALREEHRWALRADGGGVRRVIASPEPVEIVELFAIRTLVDAGVVTLCAGGGGIPVVRNGGGALRGVEAVIDKDLTSALLAEELEADLLILATDVRGILLGDGYLHRADPEHLRALDLPSGSMGPKAEAAARFVERTGGRAAIGALDELVSLVAGTAGTQVQRTDALVGR